MKTLVLGGTQFIGRHIVSVLLEGGHDVSILTRGKTPDTLPAAVERLRGDRDQGRAALKALADRSWDACIDVSGYTPRQVRPSAEVLCGTVKRYVFVSAVSVYGDPNQSERPVLESHPRLAPASEDVTEITGETYGALKVACENILEEIYAARCASLRPQIVVGPHDPSGRYSYWLRRVIRGGEILAPGDGTDPLQVIDVRDLARFARTVIENDLSGPFNLAGPRISWAEFMRSLGAKNIVWVPAHFMKTAGVTEFSLPLFRPEGGTRSGLMDISNQRARNAGLTLTEPEVTLKDTRTLLHTLDAGSWLTSEQEAELIKAARA